VVVCGETVVLPLGVTAPTPLIETVVAPVVVQLRVDLPPGWMLVGLASKRMIWAAVGVVPVVVLAAVVTVVLAELCSH